jgi:hypothetical protein
MNSSLLSRSGTGCNNFSFQIVVELEELFHAAPIFRLVSASIRSFISAISGETMIHQAREYAPSYISSL